MPIDVLLANGASAARRVLPGLFAQAGARATTVSNAHEALEVLQQSTFHGLVCSSTLDDTDCWRLVRMIRAGRFCASTLPIALMTASEAEATHFASTALDLDVHIINGLCDATATNDTIAWLTQRKRPTALVIEDDKLAATLAEQALGKTFDVEVAHDGRLGLEAWEERRHEVVLLDVRLPGLSGPEILNAIRELDSDQPVIAITAYASAEQHEELMLAGAWDFIEKPCQVEELRRACDMALRHHTLARSNPASVFTDTRRVAYRVQAADAALDTGQIAKARLHLRFALVQCLQTGSADPTDDEWLAMARDAWRHPSL